MRPEDSKQANISVYFSPEVGSCVVLDQSMTRNNFW
jgi:hypothetical protein